MNALPPSLIRLLTRRGFETDVSRASWLSPSLASLSNPMDFPQMQKSVDVLREAIDQQKPIAIYADRDVDGITGLAILVRSLRTLGGNVVWGNPLAGRGLERPVLEKLLASQAKLMILVDCGSGEAVELAWLKSQGVRVIVADHHQLQNATDAFAWIHPGMLASSAAEHPAGCVMAFKLAQALWESFLGKDDPARLNYFLWDHLDILALGILADRVPLLGENRTLVWHGLRRLSQTRKLGLSRLLRFFRLTPRTGPITVREASWQIIPLLNAAGRLHQPGRAVDLLLTEDSATASACLDDLIAFNTRRRAAQDESLAHFEALVQTQCQTDQDPVLVAMGEDAVLEPTVTGLAAQSLARKFNKPVFLFVKQGDQAVGSARGIDEHDLYAWVSAQQDLILKYGGHHGAVGLTIRATDFPAMRERLLTASRAAPPAPEQSAGPEVELLIKEGNPDWWQSLLQLEPFGPSFPVPVFDVQGISSIRFTDRKREKCVLRSAEGFEIPGKMETPGMDPVQGSYRVVASPAADKDSPTQFQWIIQEVHAHA